MVYHCFPVWLANQLASASEQLLLHFRRVKQAAKPRATKRQSREGLFPLLALAFPFDCRSRVTSRDCPKRRACLSAISVGTYYIKKIP